MHPHISGEAEEAGKCCCCLASHPLSAVPAHVRGRLTCRRGAEVSQAGQAPAGGLFRTGWGVEDGLRLGRRLGWHQELRLGTFPVGNSHIRGKRETETTPRKERYHDVSATDPLRLPISTSQQKDLLPSPYPLSALSHSVHKHT